MGSETVASQNTEVDLSQRLGSVGEDTYRLRSVHLFGQNLFNVISQNECRYYVYTQRSRDDFHGGLGNPLKL